ncbi:TPA: orotidine-5'-phosphate decarboxylase [Candidatus Woesearchaeota archaeon]|nr:orotidine-5'-phosphate decarboxylase [Candidatus Woesearchaeota archaeon]HIH31235.1 orotidine-5'-phosphate decarboxylase [Candidatus Woesearchaeota archaeon]HIH54652.1 orotidine-5'-phosphate decarboxylase [Candidatus Woesearchaeota archaeon]HIJ01384.1 orotidine-5'-phosphate decarboxylase [Candidatus Woesearchaeota archaeon]HIJ14291.1 orotidine-5'-phosphate decarboxylase [Candidatus Woesearchaeota archaeon]
MDSNDIERYKQYICLPLDVNTAEEALQIVNELKEYIGVFKVGLQLYTAEGPYVVKEIIKKGCKVFLDLKLHDIPNTVHNAVIESSKLGASFLTIHLSGGSEMIKSAIDASKKSLENNRIKILGVTMLTSITQQQLKYELNISKDMQEQVSSLVELGVKNGVDGIVCSAAELAYLRSKFEELFFVTPGIRPLWSEKNDQKRIATPSIAIEEGSSLLVIGRPILNAKNRKETIIKILEEISYVHNKKV